MSNILSSIILGFLLSMDAFSLAVIYGTMGITKMKMILASIIVGLYHLIMPIIGHLLGFIIIKRIIANANIIVGSIFIIIAVQMFFNKNENVTILTNFFSILFFGFTVSLDSFSIGIAFGITKQSIYLSAIVFMLISGSLTYLGLIFGKYLKHRFDHIVTIIGSIILFNLGIYYLLLS